VTSLVAAADLGASSGRVMVARVGPGELGLREVHRFANVPVRVGGTLYWDILRLYADVLDGLAIAGGAGGAGLASVGIDSWGIDYGLLDETGALLGNPVHYRDARTGGAAERLWAQVPAADLYAVTGIQQLPFNTVYQLAAAAGSPQLAAARTLLLIPDLLGYWLTGQAGAERTNASTTQLLDARTGEWAWPLIERAGIPRRIFPPLRQAGTVIGPVRANLDERARPVTGLPVVAVGSHDTASAVAAVPAHGRDFAYISSGTWSLVGMELDQRPVAAPGIDARLGHGRRSGGTVRPAGPGGPASPTRVGGRRGRPGVPGSRRHAGPHLRRVRPGQ
jgi:rhamnulokinase